ncbi:hypothetical protein CAter10_0608 [Collimonas arenae]|nr:hypothetical protein CAter10_0608 [Collimonas arenae]
MGDMRILQHKIVLLAKLARPIMQSLHQNQLACATFAQLSLNGGKQIFPR